MRFILILVLLASHAQAGITFFSSTGHSLYVRFDDADNTAVDLTEGTSLKLGRYAVADAAIQTAGLDAGTYSGGVYLGTAAGQASGDIRVGAFGGFRWSGTAELQPATSVDVAAIEVPPSVPVNQVPCGASRTWKLVAKGAALVGELPLFCTVDDDPVYAIDFSADLPTNGRLTDFVSIEILSAVDANGDAIEDGLEFDTDGADTFGVDKSQAKLKITAVTAGTYTLKATVEYRDADGGGTRRGKIVLKVGE